MKPEHALAKFETSYAEWVSIVTEQSPYAIVRRPPDGGWSIGQVCDHVGAVADTLLGQAERCADGEGERRRTSLFARLLFTYGSFPPMRIKLPELPAEYRSIAEPVELDRDAALARLEDVARRMRELVEPVTASDPGLKLPHPAEFWLNAGTFYQCNEMHVRHHLRQLRRLVSASPTARQP